MTRKPVKEVFIAIALMMLGACTVPSSTPHDDPSSIGVIIWRDTDTGCQYVTIKRGYGSSVTPRLNSKGTPMCSDSP